MKSLPNTLTFVDVETTGSDPRTDRIIEIGILRVENGQIVGKLNTLINPQGAYLSPFISEMTGISPAELSGAPYFDEVKSEVLSLLSNSVFVAHNVNFDYGFIKHELSRLESKFRSKTLCTVRLSRYLFPEFRRHNLDALNQRFDLQIENRHRAFDDAAALWNFYQKAQTSQDEEAFFDAVKAQLDYTIPKNLKKADVDILPESPGVYVFWGKQNDDEVVLYVGKSVNVKKRVMNHFTSAKFSRKEDRMFNEITRVEVISTHGEIGALVRESDLVKKMSPIFNAVLRRQREMLVLVRGEQNGYFTASLEKIESLNEDNIKNILGVQKSRKQAIELLRDLSKSHNLCPKLLGLEKGKGRCFNSQIGLCNGACEGQEETYKYNVRFLEAFASSLVPVWPFNNSIQLVEESDSGREVHTIDNWCYKGSIIFDKDDNQTEGIDGNVFDWDVFKIVKRAIRKGKIIENKKGLGTDQQDLF